MGDHRTCPICGGMFRACECERWAATIRLLFTQQCRIPTATVLHDEGTDRVRNRAHAPWFARFRARIFGRSKSVVSGRTYGRSDS